MSSSLAARQASKGAGPDRSADDPVVARRATIAVVAAGAVAAFLAFWFAAHRELWLDEYYTALMADLPFREMTRFLRGDVHPPLYYVSISGWQRLFGDSQLALRGFSILMHLASGAVFYRFLREATGRAYLAAMGGVLFLLSPALLFYATEARMYSLGVLLANSFLWLAWRQVTGTGGTGEAVLLGVLAALAFYTHYFTLFVSAGLFIFWGGVLVRRKASPTPWLSAAGTAVLLTAPWVPVVLRQRLGKHALDAALIASWADPDALTYMPGGGPPMREQHPIPLIVENLASLTGLYPADALPVMGLLAIPFAVVLAFAALRTLRGERGGWFVVVLAVANVAGCLIIGIVHRRYMLWLVPAIILFFCLGLLEVRARLGRRLEAGLAGALVVLTAAGAIRVARSEGYPRVRPIVEEIRSAWEPGDLVVFSALYAQVPFDYQASRMGFEPERRGFPVDLYGWWDGGSYKGWGSPVITQDDLSAFLDRFEREDRSRIWLVEFESDHYDPGDHLLAGFRRRGWDVAQCSPTDQAYRLYLVAEGPLQPCGGTPPETETD